VLFWVGRKTDKISMSQALLPESGPPKVADHKFMAFENVTADVTKEKPVGSVDGEKNGKITELASMRRSR